MLILSNLIAFVKINETPGKPKTWIEIPYPNGFNQKNSLVLIQDSGTETAGSVCFKTNNEKTKYFFNGIDGYIYTNPYFVFIKYF